MKENKFNISDWVMTCTPPMMGVVSKVRSITYFKDSKTVDFKLSYQLENGYGYSESDLVRMIPETELE